MLRGKTAAVAGAMAVASFAAAAVLSLGLARDQSTPVAGNAVVLEDAVGACYAQDSQVESCIEQAVSDSVSRSGIVPTAKDLVAVLRKDENLGGVCHQAMHWLGQMAAVGYEEHVDELIPAFPVCAFGLMHGLMESLQLPAGEGRAEAELRELCARIVGSPGILEHGTDGYLLQVDCAHGSGHSLGKSFPEDLQFAFGVCRDTFSPDERLVVDCFNGVAMVGSNEYFTTVQQADRDRDVPTSVWQGLADGVCPFMGDLAARACPGVFVQAAVDSGPHAERGYLLWCKERYPLAAAVCYDSVGSALGVVARSIDSTVDSVAKELDQVCSAGSDELLLLECWSALGNGLAQRGLGNEEAGELACAQQRAYLPEDLALRACEQALSKLEGVLEARL